MTENLSEAPNNKSRMPDTSTRAILKTAAPILFGLLLEQLIGMLVKSPDNKTFLQRIRGCVSMCWARRRN